MNQNSEAAYLHHLVTTGLKCNIYLNSSVKLVAVIEDFSTADGVIWLRPQAGHGNELMMAYLKNISTISPTNPRHLTRGALRELTGVL